MYFSTFFFFHPQKYAVSLYKWPWLCEFMQSSQIQLCGSFRHKPDPQIPSNQSWSSYRGHSPVPQWSMFVSGVLKIVQIWQYFAKDICLYVSSVYLLKNLFRLQMKQKSQQLSRSVKLISPKIWEQIVGLFSFLLEMPQGFFTQPKLLLWAMRWAVGWNTRVWLSHLPTSQRRLSVSRGRTEDEGTGSWG